MVENQARSLYAKGCICIFKTDEEGSPLGSHPTVRKAAAKVFMKTHSTQIITRYCVLLITEIALFWFRQLFNMEWVQEVLL